MAPASDCPWSRMSPRLLVKCPAQSQHMSAMRTEWLPRGSGPQGIMWVPSEPRPLNSEKGRGSGCLDSRKRKDYMVQQSGYATCNLCVQNLPRAKLRMFKGERRGHFKEKGSGSCRVYYELATTVQQPFRPNCTTPRAGREGLSYLSVRR